MNILVKVVIAFYKDLLNILLCTSQKWDTLDELIDLVSEASQKAARGAVEAIVETYNWMLFLGGGLAGAGFRRKERTIKTIHTSLGDLFLRRDTYQHKETGKCIPVLFEALGITPHQRTSKELMYKVEQLAAGMSFQKAIDATGAGICKQTAINWLRNKIPALESVVEPVLRVVAVLHVFLDEDHLAALKDPKRKHMIMPVGVVAEGHELECDGRYRLIHPFYFMNENLDPKDLVASIGGYIASQYDLGALQKIYVHGDGASWIGKALEEFANARYVFDGFHFERALRRCVGRFQKDDSKKLLELLRTAVQTANKDMAEAVLTTFGAQSGDEHVRLKTDEFQSYLLKYWDAIVSRVKSCPLGSCTEAMVEHVASERFSSTPHGWSRLTVGRLAALRTFLMNGGSLEHSMECGQPVGTYAKYIDESVEQLRAKSWDFSIFEHEFYVTDKDSGTQHLMELLSHGGQLHLGQ